MIIHPGGKLQQDTNQQLVFGVLSVRPGGLLTHGANTSTRSFLINLNVIGDFDLQAGSTIEARALGYAGSAGFLLPGSGPGGGGGAGNGDGGGGGHGGTGGQGSAGAPGGLSNDSTTSPTDLGSGGGGDYSSGGAGGGAVLITVGGTFSLNGAINADGGNGRVSGVLDRFSGHGSGGGAGGSVNLTAAALSGAGLVLASGGAGASGLSTRGGGGGGRIAIVVTGTDSSNLNLQADSGNSGGAAATSGGAGTITLKTPGGADYSLSIGNLTQAPQSASGVGGAAPAFGAVTLNNSIVNFDAGSNVTINSLVVAGGARVTGHNFFFGAAAPLTVRPGGSLQFSAGKLTSPTGSPIEVQGGASLAFLVGVNVGGSLIVRGGGTFRQLNTQLLSFDSVSVEPGGVLTHAANASVRSALLNLNVTGDFNLQAGATIAAAALGYAGGAGFQKPGFGPGGGGSSGNSDGAGGGHGGSGGQGSGGALGGLGYDSVTSPAGLGSGGGGAGPSATGGPGGAGGGAVLVAVGGTFFINGAINASGGNGIANGSGHSSGGGAGGTVNVTAAALSGAGKILANGGAGGSGGSTRGGGGGGGRVAIVVTGADSSNLNLQANSGNSGGAGATNGGAGVLAAAASTGALYKLTIGNAAAVAQAATLLSGAAPAFAQISVTNSTVTFDAGSTAAVNSLVVAGTVTLNGANLVFGADSPLLVSGGAALSLNGESLSFGANAPLEIEGGATLRLAVQGVSGGVLNVRGNGLFRQMNTAALTFLAVTVEPGGVITHAANGSSRTSLVNLNVTGNFDLQPGAVIAVNALGYAGGAGFQKPGLGPGGGGSSGNSDGAGGGHGGSGGQGSGGALGGLSYDSVTGPSDLGAGGGGAGPSATGGPGGAGGGAVLIAVGGTFSVNGAINAGGGHGAVNGSGHSSGGGAGGTVSIRAAAVAGSGTVQANGGAGGSGGSTRGGGGGGGRINVTVTGGGSPGTLQVNGGMGGGLNAGAGAHGTILGNGVLSGGAELPVALLAFSQMEEKLSTTRTLGETVSAQLLDFAGATSTGVPAGTFSLAELRLVMIKTGPFANKGFFRGRWTLVISGGGSLAGEWEGMAFSSLGDPQRLVLKGALKGQLQGTLDGSLTQSAPGSGIFDRLAASGRLVAVGNTMGASTIYIAGTGVVRESVQYPATTLSFLQASQSGEVGGFYSTPLDVVFSLVRVDSPGHPYHGEGFFAASYDSPLGPGSGWAYGASSASDVRLAGVFDQALRGLMAGALTLEAPRALFLTLQNLDAGLPFRGEVTVSLAVPGGNVPVGGVATVIVELRNDGYAVAEGVSVVAVAPEKSRFLSATGDYRSYHVTHWRGNDYVPKPFVRWDFPSVPARSSQKMSYQVRLAPGTQEGFQAGVGVETVTKAWADAIFASYELGETP